MGVNALMFARACIDSKWAAEIPEKSATREALHSHSRTRTRPTGMPTGRPETTPSEFVRYLAYKRSSCSTTRSISSGLPTRSSPPSAGRRAPGRGQCSISIRHEVRLQARRFRMDNGQT